MPVLRLSHSPKHTAVILKECAHLLAGRHRSWGKEHRKSNKGLVGRCRSSLTGMRVPKRDVNFVPMHDAMIFSICSRSLVSMGNASSSTMDRASSSALLYPRMITVGCRLRSRKGSATCSISPAAHQKS